MKRANTFLIVAVLLLFFAGSAWAVIDVTLTSPQTTYMAGQENSFTFNVGLIPNIEWVDRYQFTFPAGITVVSATPASGSGGCNNNDGVQSICSPSVSWARTGVPCSGIFSATACGAYSESASVFNVTVSIPVGFTGPLDVTLNSIGDGFAQDQPTTDTDMVTFARSQPAASIPTLNEWGLICLSLLMIGAGYNAMRRRGNASV